MEQIDLDISVISLAGLIEQNYSATLPKVDSISIATGFHGVFSGFKSKILQAASRYNVDAMEVINKLGKSQVIAGQEDQIIYFASKLAKEKND